MLVARGGMFTVMVNYQWLCMQSSKDMKARQGTLCYCKAPVQMFTEREEVERQILGHWKSSEEWALGSKTSTSERGERKWQEI